MTPLAFRFLKVLSVAGVAALVVGACGGGGGGNNTGGLASDQTFKFPILGDFGTLVLVAHDWDDRGHWLHSLELFCREVLPAVRKRW